jgi:hypothetical protein
MHTITSTVSAHVYLFRLSLPQSAVAILVCVRVAGVCKVLVTMPPLDQKSKYPERSKRIYQHNLADHFGHSGRAFVIIAWKWVLPEIRPSILGQRLLKFAAENARARLGHAANAGFAKC